MLVYHGSTDSRRISREVEFYHGLTTLNDFELKVAQFNILLVPFDTLRHDFNHLVQLEWQAFVVDEGQKMKNN